MRAATPVASAAATVETAPVATIKQIMIGITNPAAYVVYDVLPAVSPRFNGYRSTLEVLLPIAIAVSVLAGRRVTMVVLAVIAVGQTELDLPAEPPWPQERLVDHRRPVGGADEQDVVLGRLERRDAEGDR